MRSNQLGVTFGWPFFVLTNNGTFEESNALNSCLSLFPLKPGCSYGPVFYICQKFN